MEEKTRTEYSARNTSVAVICRCVAILMGFLTRVVFTHTLSESYVGINGLFSDILNVLALSELGISTAITYALYRPIAERDIAKQQSLMRLYQRCYRVVAVVVLVAGLLVIPFLPVLVKDGEGISNLVLIYLMYLANSVLSYLFVYKRTLIDAYQLSYIGVLYQTIFLVVQDVIQILILIATKNFVLFLLVYLVCTFGNNFAISKKADALYPFLKEKEVPPLPKEEQQSIFKHMRAMMMHKIGNVVVNNTDNLLLSSMVGLLSVGRYSNYYLLIGSVRQILNQIFQGITASVGNLGVTEDTAHVKRIFDASFFIGQWMFGWAAVCLFELLGPFVEISFGTQYVFAGSIEFVLCLNFYITGMRQAVLVFRDSLGLFWYDRYKAVAESVINLVVSILLAWQFGAIGVFIGTFVSTVTTSLWIEPLVLYRHHLKEPVSGYFARYLLYTAVWAVIGIVTHFACSLVSGSVWMLLFGRLLLCLCIPPVILLLCYYRTNEFQFILNKGKGLYEKRVQKSRKAGRR